MPAPFLYLCFVCVLPVFFCVLLWLELEAGGHGTAPGRKPDRGVLNAGLIVLGWKLYAVWLSNTLYTSNTSCRLARLLSRRRGSSGCAQVQLVVLGRAADAGALGVAIGYIGARRQRAVGLDAHASQGCPDCAIANAPSVACHGSA